MKKHFLYLVVALVVSLCFPLLQTSSARADDKVQETIQDLDKKIQSEPKNANAYAKRASLKALLNQDYQGALKDFNQAIALDPGIDVYRWRGSTKMALHDYEGAIQDFSKAIELKPKDAVAYYKRGESKVALKKDQQALDDFNAAIGLDPKQPKFYNDRGLAKFRLEDYQGALRDLDSAVALDPKSAPTFRDRGDVKVRIQDNEGALQDFNKSGRPVGDLE